ncbi:M23 family metallopeptidase [Oxobacter pfennigii]|nr:M23 family metallopeptidase [Oxobacter pfennigii]
MRTIKKPDIKTLENMANQLIVSAVIILLVIVLSSIQNPMIARVITGVKWVVGTDYDFKTAALSFRNNLFAGADKESQAAGNMGELSGRTEAIDAQAAYISSLMIIPVEGKITSPFGLRINPINKKQEQHTGIDIAAENGAPIKAALDGVVIKTENNDQIGKAVTIKHEGGVETLYGHCSEILVSVNDVVKKGDHIANVGDTGQATSYHLHFEIRKDGNAIDPINVIPDMKELE